MSVVGEKTVSAGTAKNDHLSGMSISLEASGSVAADVLATSVAIDMKERMVLKSERVAPDGGYGWLVSVMTFLVTFLLTGFLKSFSVWRAFVMEEFPDTSTGEAAWISGCIGTFSLTCSPFTSGLLARFGNGPMVSAGCLVCALGFLISSFATSALYLIGSLGVCVGVGSSFLITASVGCTGKFFTTRKPTAMTIALSGGCLGAIVMPYILRPLFSATGMHYGFMALSGIFALLSLSGMIYANPESHFTLEEKEVPAEEENGATEPATEKTLFERVCSVVMELMALKYLRNPLFITMAISVLALNMGSPHFLGQISGQARRLGASADKISLLTLLVQLADLLARLVYGMLASKSPFRRTSEYTFVLATCALCAILAIFCNAFWQLAVLSFFGSFAVGVMNISIPLVLSYNHGAKNMSNTLNLARWFQGFSGFVYRFISPEVPSDADVPGLLILNTVHLWFAAISGMVLCFLPKEEN